MRLTLALAAMFVIGGCSSPNVLPRDSAQAEMFGPSAMIFHPFTAVKSFSGGDAPEGIEAMIEFDDQFGDPAKASGRLIFELYEYRRADPDPRGKRLAYWAAPITSLAEQREHWNRISRTYSFQLGYKDISAKASYVLSAIFESSSGGRLFAQIVLEAPTEEPSATQPTTVPSSQPVTP